MNANPPTAQYSRRMPSPSAILLRVLLSIALILNGSGYAVAAAQMQLAQGATTSGATHAMPRNAAGSCHEQDMAAMAMKAPVVATDASQPDNPVPDCCKSDQCVCASMHASLTMASASLREADIDRTIASNAKRVDHAAPVLAHPIRPPIG